MFCDGQILEYMTIFVIFTIFWKRNFERDTRKVVQNMTLKNKLKLKQQFIGKFIFMMNDDLQSIHVYSI